MEKENTMESNFDTSSQDSSVVEVTHLIYLKKCRT